jgi:hypothetical protein
VSERAALLRAQLALATLGLTAVLLISILAVDAFHHRPLEPHPHLLLAAVDVLVIGRALASLFRQLRMHRALLRRLPVACETTIHGHRVRVLPCAGMRAFCGGLLRPAIYVSEDALLAGDAELRAILAHEEHHCARRDPLRQLLARALSDAFRPVQPFASLAARQAALADLAADRAAVTALGRVPLASAMVRFEEGIAPERVDRLLGTGSDASIPVAMLGAAWLALVAIAAVIATMLLAGWHPELTLMEPAVLVAISAPACLAAWRAGAWMRPAGN